MKRIKKKLQVTPFKNTFRLVLPFLLSNAINISQYRPGNSYNLFRELSGKKRISRRAHETKEHNII